MTVFGKGLLGEMRARRYLQRQGMRFLRGRYRAAHGEIDLIMKDGETIVFTEVKYRSDGMPGSGVRAVDADKRRRLKQAAGVYLSLYPADDVRFDVVEITRSGIRHIRSAF